MQNFLSLWLNAGAQITHGGQVQRPRQIVRIVWKINDSIPVSGLRVGGRGRGGEGIVYTRKSCSEWILWVKKKRLQGKGKEGENSLSQIEVKNIQLNWTCWEMRT